MLLVVSMGVLQLLEFVSPVLLLSDVVVGWCSPCSLVSTFTFLGSGVGGRGGVLKLAKALSQ